MGRGRVHCNVDLFLSLERIGYKRVVKVIDCHNNICCNRDNCNNLGYWEEFLYNFSGKRDPVPFSEGKLYPHVVVNGGWSILWEIIIIL